ncbi:MAG: hypothetical protein QF632_00035, partial [Candidatus Woesearchaeota archaeon]|nr:hypothetical protein [Candidatus Woesearchaeota archaeon]
DDLTLEATDVSLVGQAKGAAGKEKFVYGTVTDCNKIVKGVSGKDIFFRGTTRIVDPCKLSRKGQKKLNIDLACDVSDDNFKSHELKDKCKNKDEMKIYSCDGQERLISQIFKCPHGCNKDKNHCKKTKGLSLTEKSQRGQDMIIDMQSKTNVKATKSYGKSPAKMVRI